MMNKQWLSYSLMIAALVAPLCSTDLRAEQKSGYKDNANFAGPASTVYQLEDDDEIKTPVFGLPVVDQMLQPWFDFKKSLNDDYGLQFGLEYTTVYQQTSDEIEGEDDHAWSGIVRAKGKWGLLNRGQVNQGALVFSVDNRANYSDVSPADFGNNIGFIAQPAYLFSDVDNVLVDFHWQQLLSNGRTGFIVGRFDPSDFMHVLGHKSPWTSFQNLNVSLDSSIAYPDLGVGAGVGHWFEPTTSGQFYLLGGFNDANGKITEEKAFQHGAEFFKFFELGWTPSRQERYSTNLHITFWDVDEREHDGVNAAKGVAVGTNYTWQQLTVFGQVGISDTEDDADPQIYKNSYTTGLTYNIRNSSDQFGLAVNYGELAVAGLGEQTVVESYYRLQLTANMALTPSVQFIDDPALHPEKSSVTLFGLRLRLTF
ncbi:carbohydrate porin [Oceanicoccus sagamiensis]|uniref:Uncharacterized protein n=1 Tax=Oceanicoccus sagamiensis TaxID=716816 RepID=A0A1X9NER5_9GAMM|nr:carbohydrate porin [Oceanicoccus sagamiensis]ARN74375.1 hypothetical protein BST96_09720 [Oceanicoccus sagamiensis]